MAAGSLLPLLKYRGVLAIVTELRCCQDTSRIRLLRCVWMGIGKARDHSVPQFPFCTAPMYRSLTAWAVYFSKKKVHIIMLHPLHFL